MSNDVSLNDLTSSLRENSDILNDLYPMYYSSCSTHTALNSASSLENAAADMLDKIQDALFVIDEQFSKGAVHDDYVEEILDSLSCDGII